MPRLLGTVMRAAATTMIVVAVTAMLAFHADARIGSGLSLGSRGTRTYSAPPSTTTAPYGAPMQRSVTQPGYASPVRTSPFGGGLFGRSGMFGGFFAGLFTAGLLGLLFGHGFLGGGFFAFIGMIVQFGLIALVAMLVWRYFQRRPAAAYAGPYRDGGGLMRANLGGGSGYGAGTAGAAGTRSDRIGISGADYDAFERLLGETQAAYNAEDVGALRSRVTPEMLSYFSEDLARNASRGVVNRVSDVKLLQGDLAEAWREGDTDYATVAMRFSLIDATVDRATGRVVDGDPVHPQQATEVWTFRRARGGPWMLSAIQQAA
jgi:predicted lipid-binding transport protein (Tim44 family)